MDKQSVLLVCNYLTISEHVALSHTHSDFRMCLCYAVSRMSFNPLRLWYLPESLHAYVKCYEHVSVIVKDDQRASLIAVEDAVISDEGVDGTFS